MDPTAVVTGLFHQVLREDPTAAQLSGYLTVYSLTGVNGVVAGLFSSTAFRQTEVNNYYLELLNRNATPQELAWGATQLVWGLPEPLLAASIAGSDAFYQASSSSGGRDGVPASATTFVNALYRSLLGQTADPITAPIYVQQTQAGTPNWLTALQFVTAEPFRAAKVGEIYAVTGLTPNETDVSNAVNHWFLNGGLAGIATVLLASAANISKIQETGAPLPDLVAASQLTTLLLAPYDDSDNGFSKALNRALHTNPAGGTCAADGPSCNPGLLDLIRNGGAVRGLPNTSLTVTGIAVDVKSLVPTQNEIDMLKSLTGPLTSPVTLTTYFNGGIITPPPGVGGSSSTSVLTADGGRYIVDGHHRWSAIFVINPNARVSALDVNYVPSPQTSLKETQVAIAAELETVKTSIVEGTNLFTVDETEFDATVSTLLVGTYVAAVAAADLYGPSGLTPDPDLYAEALQVIADQIAVGQVFKDRLGLPDVPGSPTELEKLEAYAPSVAAFMWQNVQVMRAGNQPVTGAPPRSVMPQAEPIAPILSRMNGGTLSYSFPVISYLG